MFLLLPAKFSGCELKAAAGEMGGEERRRRRSHNELQLLPTLMTDLTVMKQDVYGLFFKTLPAFVLLSFLPILLRFQRPTFFYIFFFFYSSLFHSYFRTGILFLLAAVKHSCRNKMSLTRFLEVDEWHSWVLSVIQTCGMCRGYWSTIEEPNFAEYLFMWLYNN